MIKQTLAIGLGLLTSVMAKSEYDDSNAEAMDARRQRALDGSTIPWSTYVPDQLQDQAPQWEVMFIGGVAVAVATVAVLSKLYEKYQNSAPNLPLIRLFAGNLPEGQAIGADHDRVNPRIEQRI
jgi:hypothetical protein